MPTTNNLRRRATPSPVARTDSATPARRRVRRGGKGAIIPAAVIDVPLEGQAKRGRWLKVERAREFLEGKSQLAAKMFIKAMKIQAARGDTHAAEFLLTHVASIDPQGREVRALSIGVDRPAALTASEGPRIQIGIGLGADFAAYAARNQIGSAPSTVNALPAPSDSEE